MGNHLEVIDLMNENARLTRENEAMRMALEEIDATIDAFERTMTLPGPKELKEIWYCALAALSSLKETTDAK